MELNFVVKRENQKFIIETEDLFISSMVEPLRNDILKFVKNVARDWDNIDKNQKEISASYPNERRMSYVIRIIRKG